MNHITLSTNGLSIGDHDIAEESLKITETLCSDTKLAFGECSATTYTLRVRYNKPLPSQDYDLTITGDNAMTRSRLRLLEDKPTADRCYRDIKLADRMYTILNKTVTSWYNGLFPTSSTGYTLKQFRDSFFTLCGFPQVEAELPNDSMTIGKTIDAETITGKAVITAICQVNGCFGHINNAGWFEYVFLKQMSEGLMPHEGLKPHIGLKPYGGANASKIRPGEYISAKYDDFKTETIDKVQVRQTPEDVGGIAGTGTNCYIIEDNFLCYGKSGTELATIAQNVLNVVQGLWYTPATVVAAGNAALHVGDGVRLHTKNGTIYTYILTRKMEGIQFIKDTYQAKGTKNFSTKVQTVNDSIIKLTGKTNQLTRTVEQLDSKINDEHDGLQSQITQNAAAIQAVVLQSFEGNIITNEMLGDDTEDFSGSTIPCDYGEILGGLGFTIEGTSKTVGPFRIAAQNYSLSFMSRSDDWVYADCQVYLVNESGHEEWLDLIPASVTDNWWMHEAQFTVTTGGYYHLRFEVNAPWAWSVCDLMLTTGQTALPWSPNRGDEWSMVSQNAQMIEARVEKTGGDAASFSWELLANGFVLKANNNEIFRADANGVTVNGYTKTSELEAQFARIDAIEADYITSDEIEAVTATVERLDGDVANLNTAVIGKLDAETAELTYATIATVNANTANIGTLNTAVANLNKAVVNKLDVTTASATYATISTVNANKASIDTLTGRVASIEKITSKAITTDNLQAQKLSVNQITAACSDPTQGTIKIGEVDTSVIKIYDGASRSYKQLKFVWATVGGQQCWVAYREK